MKKWFIMMIAIVCTFSLATACSNGGNGNKEAASNSPAAAEATSTPAASTAPEASPAATEAPAEPYELKVSVAGTDTPGLEELAKAFESQNQGAKITISRIKDPGQYTTLLNTQLATSDAPDIFYMWPGLGVRDVYVKGNYVEDLSDLTIMSKIGEGLKQPFTYDGKTYFIPFTSNFLGLFYNKDVFAKAGVQVPTDWKQFEQVSDALKKISVTPISLIVKDFPAWYWYMAAPPLVYANDPDWNAKRLDGTVQFATAPGWQTAAARLKEMYDNNYVQADSLGVTYDQTRAMMISGKAGMYIDGNWALPTIKEAAEKAGISVGAFIFPFNDPGQPLRGAASPSTGPGVWTGSKHKDEAKQFLEFLFADENVQKYVGDGNIPTNGNVQGTPDPIIADILAQNQKEGTYPFLDAVYPAGDWGTVIQTATQQSVGGKADFDKTLKDMDELWDKSVKDAQK